MKITCRSIDGRLWYAGHGCWTDEKTEALDVSLNRATAIIAEEKERNKKRDLDGQLGHLAMVES